MSKHTPGPWVAPADQCNLVTTKRAWESQDMGTLAHAFQAIVSLKEGEEQARANARLISACPDLLEACKHAVERLKKLDEYRKTDSSASIGLIQRAIAKATGDE